MATNAAPNISLTNFTDAKFKTCEYVLTSPRSLRACANLKIQPVDLLPQNFEDFKKSKDSTGLRRRNALMETHEQLEKERRIKLWKARKERDRIIEAECKSEHETKKSSSSLSCTNSDQLPIKDQRILMALLHKRNKQLETESFDVAGPLDTTVFKLEKAAANKEMLDTMKLQKIKSKNFDERQRFERTWLSIEKQKRSEEDYVRESLDIKEAEAGLRLYHQAVSNSREQSFSKEKRELKELQRKVTAERCAAELHEWRKNVEEFSKLSVSKATKINKQLLHEKSMLTQLKRKEKEFNQSQTMRRFKKQENEQKEKSIQKIEQKYKRVEDFLEQRNNKILESHSIAHLTAQLRESIINHSNSFNDALIYAEQRNKFEQRQPVGEYNQIRHCSKVFL